MKQNIIEINNIITGTPATPTTTPPPITTPAPPTVVPSPKEISYEPAPTKCMCQFQILV